MQPKHIRKYALACAALALLGHAAGAEYRESRVSDAGTVQGRIHFEGDYPAAETLRPDRDADTCGLRIPVEQFVVDGDSKGLANAIVKIEGISAGKPFSSAGKSVEQIKCRYEPHVLVVRPGESFNIVNRDPVLHNVHAYRGDETVFNLAQPFQGQASPQTLDHEGPVRVSCDVHNWMEAWVLVLDSPYFSVTDQNGAFSIDGVPPGEYTVTMWHEALGSASKTVTIEAGGSSEVDFVIGG